MGGQCKRILYLHWIAFRRVIEPATSVWPMTRWPAGTHGRLTYLTMPPFSPPSTRTPPTVAATTTRPDIHAEDSLDSALGVPPDTCYQGPLQQDLTRPSSRLVRTIATSAITLSGVMARSCLRTKRIGLWRGNRSLIRYWSLLRLTERDT